MNGKLVAARKSRNWNQAKASEEIGVDLRTFQRWEREGSIPQPYYRDKLCEVFGMSLKDLGYDFLAVATIKPVARFHSNGTQISPLNGTEEQRDWASWFGLKLAQILGLLRMTSIWNNDFSEEIQTLIDQEIKMIDETLEQHQMVEQQAISRRQALVTIAALPLVLLGLRSGPIADTATQEFLSQCAASITACWHLLRGNGLTSVSDIIPQFIPQLKTFALHSSKYQKTAARLAAQASILQAILAMHWLNFAGREAHCKDAIRYASISEDKNLQATALTYLGYTYSFCYLPRQPEKAIQTFLMALQTLGNDAPLLKSNISMGLAEAFAQCKEEQQALHYINLAQTHFPTYPELDPSYIYGDCSLHVLYQWEGKMYLELAEHYSGRGYQRKAADALLQGSGVQSISARSTTETIIYQADASRVLGELDIYITSLTQAAQMARDLRSQKRYSEAFSVFEKTPDKWRREQQVQILAKDVFGLHPRRK
jgi:transcriptional regulator with XRE-family HTH domain